MAVQTWDILHGYLFLSQGKPLKNFLKNAKMQPNSKTRVDALAIIIDSCYKKFLNDMEKKQPMSEQQMMSMLEILVDASGKLQHMRYTNSSGVWHGVKVYQKVIKNL
jgi:hypothetical protein